MGFDVDLVQNMQARRDAEDVFTLVDSEPRTQRFWEVLRDLVDSRIPKQAAPSGPLPMTEVAAIAFECGLMPFGKHQGREIGCVPIEYLIWMAEGDEFNKQMRRYLKSERGQKRIREEQE